MLDCTGCPRIGDYSVGHLIPKMVKKRGAGEQLKGCPQLKNVYFCGTSVTDSGIRQLLASKLVASVKHLGVSEHVTKARVDEVKSRNIKVSGGSGSLIGNVAPAGGSLTSFDAIPAALAAAGAALLDPKWLEDLGDLLRFTACWPDDN